MNNGLVNQKENSLLSPTLCFDSYFLSNTPQQGAGAAKKEQSLHLLLPTCFPSMHPLYIKTRCGSRCLLMCTTCWAVTSTVNAQVLSSVLLLVLTT